MKLIFVFCDVGGDTIDVDVHILISADVADIYGDGNNSARSQNEIVKRVLLQEKITLYEYYDNRIRSSVDVTESALSAHTRFVSPWPRSEHLRPFDLLSHAISPMLAPSTEDVLDRFKQFQLERCFLYMRGCNICL